ncbi:hypothetical protein SNK03_009372 [Fusarium graminearum]|uniref:Chromosome 4, complete genome n=2 Tax=Gibberella zeae TaxID=5518 RepID=I1RUJ0_GIBZE|nr:hypothetical protein FGSG_07884 [Fusarium graminearum PH-1]EYB30357.1 hypothetical protein FG05_07884 [Fusarium graminearum]ESU14209.1 hypothetical protein FGSG_07884 [Fusarium graminearum PH-1]PCD29762.1 hypothetical protein FGRA07_10766 [Fusarium graminearum]CAF3453417.1 unnamed protein product [Fusarium graminearum]CAG1964842.1 unnamed protein product [Fusarium graminearum]|eukprot:XP_011327716.1 hypothetical protein FGSG_07884 [Fusarium graminearum PH-1]
MPRRRPPGNPKPVQRRTRSGCQTCRTRKVKCDEAKPACRNCITRGVECNNSIQLKWESEFTARGASFGREGVWAKEDRPRRRNPVAHSPTLLVLPSIEPRHFINTYHSDFAGNPNLEKSLVREAMQLREEAACGGSTALTHRSPSASPSLKPSISSFPTLNTHQRSLFEYYLLRLCPLTTPSSQLSSPFASLVAPLFTNSGQDLLIQSVLAFAARHRSIKDRSWERSAMRMKGNALTGLLKKIRSPDVTADVILDPQVPAIMMFLCLYEIIDNGDYRWVFHLRASQNFMRKRRQIALPSSDNNGFGSLAMFAERYFAFQDVISRTACGNPPIFGLEYWQRPDHREDIDAWMGCSPAMASVIFKITDLARTRNKDQSTQKEYQLQVEDLERELVSVSSNITAAETMDENVRRSVDLKKTSVQLYFHCLLRDGDPSTLQVAQLVTEVLQSIYSLIQHGSAAGLSFPLFVAAVQLDPLRDDEIFFHEILGTYLSGRQIVLEILDAMVDSSLANIERTKAVILKVWRMRDLHTQSASPSVDMGDVSDWSYFVSPFTQNLNLA